MMENEMPGGPGATEPQGAPPGQQEDDPMKVLGQGIMAMVDGLSKAPPEVAKAAAGVGQAFQNLMQVLGGGQGPQEPAQAGGAAMQGGNPNAMPVR